MAFWQEIALKGFVLLLTIMALCGAMGLGFLGWFANGNATVPDPFSWRMAFIVFAVWASQIWLSIAGCISIWQWIERWSDEIKTQR